MKRSRFLDEQIISVLKEHQAGLSAAELCRKHGISDAIFLQMVIQIWWHEGFRRQEAEDP